MCRGVAHGLVSRSWYVSTIVGLASCLTELNPKLYDTGLSSFDSLMAFICSNAWSRAGQGCSRSLSALQPK